MCLALCSDLNARYIAWRNIDRAHDIRCCGVLAPLNLIAFYLAHIREHWIVKLKCYSEAYLQVDRRGEKWTSWWERWSFRHSHHFVAISAHGKEELLLF